VNNTCLSSFLRTPEPATASHCYTIAPIFLDFFSPEIAGDVDKISEEHGYSLILISIHRVLFMRDIRIYLIGEVLD
jgi:hypothetical protein